MNIYPQQSDHPLFRYFTDDERARAERIGVLKMIPPHAELIRAGDTDSTLYAVEKNHLDIVGSRDGHPAILATVGPGDVLGEVSFIDDSPRTVSVRAGEEPVTVRVWERKALTEALAFDPQMMAKFAVALCELLVERMRDSARRV